MNGFQRRLQLEDSSRQLVASAAAARCHGIEEEEVVEWRREEGRWRVV